MLCARSSDVTRELITGGLSPWILVFSRIVYRGNGGDHALCTVISISPFLFWLFCGCCVKSSMRGDNVIILGFVAHGRGRHRGFPVGSTRVHLRNIYAYQYRVTYHLPVSMSDDRGQ